jgi:hypothetical protein
MPKLPTLMISNDSNVESLWLTVPTIVPAIWIPRKIYKEQETVSYHGETFISVTTNSQQPPPSPHWKAFVAGAGQYTYLPMLTRRANGDGIHFVMIRPVYSLPSAYPCLYWS